MVFDSATDPHNMHFSSQRTFTVNPVDEDGDGYYSIASGGDDCDDTNVSINPAATEVCDLVDNNCDGITDEGCGPFEVSSVAISGITASAQYCAPIPISTVGALINFTGAAGQTVHVTWYLDDEHQVDYTVTANSPQSLTYLYNYASTTVLAKFSVPGPHTAKVEVAYPIETVVQFHEITYTVTSGTTEVCDGLDNDCDGKIDEGVTTTFYRDIDGDTYGNLNITIPACSTPVGYVANNSDCDDTNFSVNPGATEVCNGLDDDCDGQVDEGEGVKITYYRDSDGDTFGNPNITLEACSLPTGYVVDHTDCDDNDPLINPDETDDPDINDCIDNDCSGSVALPEGSDPTDTDGDGLPDLCDDDDDNDGYLDEHEGCTGCGGNPLDAGDTPIDENGNFIPDVLEGDMDIDEDGVNNGTDNCLYVLNPLSTWTDINGVEHTNDQPDYDLDGVGDACDNCPYVATLDLDQADADADNVGDACDNAPNDWNPNQADTDKDADGVLAPDGVPDVIDNCPQSHNPMVQYNTGDSSEECAISKGLVIEGMWQPDYDCDGLGFVCDGDDWSTKPKIIVEEPPPPPADSDKDGVADTLDNCPNVANPKQTDLDGDEQGDACDSDDDNDLVNDGDDNCLYVANPLPTSTWTDIYGNEHSAAEQLDYDLDGLGDACDPDDDDDYVKDECDADNNPNAPDADGDGIVDACDNCPQIPNPITYPFSWTDMYGNDHFGEQEDYDLNGTGDACEPEVRIQLTFEGSDTSYDEWLTTDGAMATIRAVLVDSGGAPISDAPSIELDLPTALTSKLPGRYTNDDSGDTSYDFDVVSGGTDFIEIRSLDYGGSAVVSANVIYNGQMITGELRVPKDTDGDGLPDWIEIQWAAAGFDPFNKDSIPSVPDEAGNVVPVLDGSEDLDTHTNGVDIGDRLTAFEEYRGVWWNDVHMRLNPTKKDLFICGVDFPQQTVQDGFYFDVGTALENCGIAVHTIETISTGALWSQIDKNYRDNNLDVLIVRYYPTDLSWSDRHAGHIYRVDVRAWNIGVFGESYFGYTDASGVSHYGQPTRIFQRAMESYFMDKPYEDYQDSGILEKLDPIGSVEDKNDNGVLDKKEDANRNGIFEGDKVVVGDYAQDLNPFDIDNDSFVELPQQTEPTAVDTGWTAVEYSRADVARHVITHEIGHSLGMGAGDPDAVDSVGHCIHDQKCVMYQYSIDWKRDGYFCPYHQAMIKIQNN